MPLGLRKIIKSHGNFAKSWRISYCGMRWLVFILLFSSIFASKDPGSRACLMPRQLAAWYLAYNTLEYTRI